jgi:hypothetical protein
MNKSYEFISYPYESFVSGGATRTRLNMVIEDQDVTLDEMLEQFEYFLKGAGYQIDVGQHLELVDSEEDEVTEAWETMLEAIDDDFGDTFDMSVLDQNIEKAFEGWNPEEEPDPIDPEISINYQDVTRVEVIDDEGRVYVNTDVAYVVTDLQDEGRTLKVFIK